MIGSDRQTGNLRAVEVFEWLLRVVTGYLRGPGAAQGGRFRLIVLSPVEKTDPLRSYLAGRLMMCVDTFVRLVAHSVKRFRAAWNGALQLSDFLARPDGPEPPST